MKTKLMLSFALVAGLSLSGFAQSTSTTTDNTTTTTTTKSGEHHGHHRMDPDKMIAHLDKKLNLTADEKTNIKGILESSQKKAQDLKSNTSASETDRKTQMKQLHEDTHSQIRAALTPDQQTKFDAMMKKHEEGAEKHHHHQKSSNTTTTSTTPE